jgi:aerobic-type carbon monoxide dehydrogenase small subunit (CoxS/CutS family)
MKQKLDFRLNGQPASLDIDDDRLLLWVLRTELELTGPKYGCGEGICGACTVTVDGKAVRSCRTSLKGLAGRQVVTIEGLAATVAPGQRASAGGSAPASRPLHPLQQAFIDHGAFQCGYCTSGMLMTAAAFLRDSPRPSRAAIETHMARNLCRCGAHQRIVDAIEAVALKPPAGA